VGLGGEDLLDEFLKALVAALTALTFDLGGELVEGAEVCGIGLDGELEVGDGGGGVAAFTFEEAEEVVDLVA